MNPFCFQTKFALFCISIVGMTWTGVAEEKESVRSKWRAPVAGIVFSDENGNSIFDQTDFPGRRLKVVLVKLGEKNKELGAILTDDGGKFEFSAVPEGRYRLFVQTREKGKTSSDEFSISRGEIPPFFSLTIQKFTRGTFRGRIANPKNTEGDIVSPFSPQSGQDLPNQGTEEKGKKR